MKKNIWVVKNWDDWWVRKEWNEKLSRTFDTQQEAIDYAKPRAKDDWVEFVIQNKKWKIRDKESYGNDGFPPRG